jgi:predicted Fe-S protein YdhL (DUF1289 family)
MTSPCVRLCTLDPADNVCVGCGRTLAEIGSWMRYSEAERRAIMDALPGRLAARGAALAGRAGHEARP